MKTPHPFPPERVVRASAQQRDLYEGKGLAGDTYRTACTDLWALLDAGARPNALMTTPFAYLARKFNNLRDDAKAKPGMLDPVFRDWFAFAYHVGPRPTNKHQLDRINDGENYRLGNVRWLHATRQNSNKRGNRHHLYKGRRHTDAELSAVLEVRGVKYNEESIKKFRQRRAKAGFSDEDITREIFENHGLAYSSSGDPVEDADFSLKHRKKLMAAYQVEGGGETRMAFEIRWLQKQIDDLKKEQAEIFNLPGSAELDRELLHRIADLQWDLKEARQREAELKLKRTRLKLENTAPETLTKSQENALKPNEFDGPTMKKITALL